MNHDVIIIGGGPAGSTAASYLAMAGHAVALFEKEKFPREHVGESLLPFCYGLFKELGVLDEMIARYVRKPGVRFFDASGQTSTTWCFGHVIQDESHLSFHVTRADFDQLLLENSRRKGATVHEEVRVREVEVCEDDRVRVTVTGPDGVEQVHYARFLIDASGRDTFMATRRKDKRPNEDLDRTALSTHWRGAMYNTGMNEGLLQIVYLGGEKKGWIWVIPLESDRISVGVVLNHAYLREQVAQHRGGEGTDWRTDLYRKEVLSSPLVQGILEPAEMIMPVMFNGNYSYTVKKKFSDHWALVGDSASFIDPIFASGVYLGMNSARLVSEAVSRKLMGGDADNAGLEGAYERINGAYALVGTMIRNFYNPASLNWAHVGATNDLAHAEHKDAFALAHYLLAGDFFDRYEKYTSFLDLLANPRLFSMYKQNVMERQEYKTSECGADRSVVFGQMLAEHERMRAGEDA